MATYALLKKIKKRAFSQNKNCNGKVYQSCAYINRIIKALRFYQSLDSDNIESNDKLMQYCTEKCPSMLNDYIHLITEHNEHLEAIHESLRKYDDLQECNITTCKFVVHHHRNRNNKKYVNAHSDHKKIEYYKDLFGTIHCYLLHSFDVGLRIKSAELEIEKNESKSNDDESESETGEQCFDQAFSNIQQAVIKRESTFNKLNDFERLNNNNKFEIGIGCNEQDKKQQDENRTQITFTDGLLSHVQSTIKSKERLTTLQKFLSEEEYDTDAIIQDTNGLLSNIYKFLNNRNICLRITQYIHSTQGRFIYIKQDLHKKFLYATLL